MRYLALRQAVAKHSLLTKEAATGRGIDRHLLGLRMMLRPQDGEHSALFDDELFDRSQWWKLSTSGLSAGHLFRGTGYVFVSPDIQHYQFLLFRFGAVYNDGYGINCKFWIIVIELFLTLYRFSWARCSQIWH